MLLQLMFLACVIIITSFFNNTRAADQGQISLATVLVSNEHEVLQPKCPWVRIFQEELRLWTKTLHRYIRAGLPEICDQQNIRVTAGDNTGQNSRPIPGQNLKFLTPSGTEPRPSGCKYGALLTTPQRRTLLTEVQYNKIS